MHNVNMHDRLTVLCITVHEPHFLFCMIVFVHAVFQEMLISPALLDFLEQAIEPIPVEMVGTATSKASKAGGCLFNRSAPKY